MHEKPASRILIAFVCLYLWLALILGASIYAHPAAAQEATRSPTPAIKLTPTSEEVITRRDIPGDTTVLLAAAAILVLVAMVGILWHNRGVR